MAAATSSSEIERLLQRVELPAQRVIQPQQVAERALRRASRSSAPLVSPVLVAVQRGVHRRG